MTGLVLNPMMLQASGSAPAGGVGANTQGATNAATQNNGLFSNILGQIGATAITPISTVPLIKTGSAQDEQAALLDLANFLEQNNLTFDDLVSGNIPQGVTVPEVVLTTAQQLLKSSDAAKLIQNAANSADATDIYTLTTTLRPVDTASVTTYGAQQSKEPGGLLGSRDNVVNEQSLQAILARIPNAGAQPTQQTQALPQESIQTSVLADQKNVTVLSQNVGALASAQAANPLSDTNNKDNPLLAITKKVAASVLNQVDTQQTVAEAAKASSNLNQPLNVYQKNPTFSGLVANGTVEYTNMADNGAATPNNPVLTGQHTPALTTPSHLLSAPGEGQELPHHKPVPLDQLNVRIAQAAKTGDSKIDIQLEPVSLGKIQVHIDMSANRTNITIYAEKHDTLELLKNDSVNLQKTLAEAGIKTDAGSLQFAHKESSGFNFAQNENGNNAYRTNDNNPDAGRGDNASVGTTAQQYRVYESNQALDIFA